MKWIFFFFFFFFFGGFLSYIVHGLFVFCFVLSSEGPTEHWPLSKELLNFKNTSNSWGNFLENAL